MSNYRDFVKILARDRIDKRFLNQDNKHAIDVFSEMFENSEISLRIFAKNLCNEVTNSGDYISSISNFIEKGGSVKILLNGYEEQLALNSNLFKRLAYYVSEGKNIQIKPCSVQLHLSNDLEKKEVHFAVADDRAYRIETDITQRTAEVNYNNPQLANVYASTFDNIFKESINIIDLGALFNLKNESDE